MRLGRDWEWMGDGQETAPKKYSLLAQSLTGLNRTLVQAKNARRMTHLTSEAEERINRMDYLNSESEAFTARHEVPPAYVIGPDEEGKIKIYVNGVMYHA